MGKVNLALSAAALTAIAGCATPYQRAGFRGGFEETQLGPNAHVVSFSGNAYVGHQRAYDFALMRAADLTLRAGGKYFVIHDSDRRLVADVGYKPLDDIRFESYRDNPPAGALDAAFVQKSIREKYPDEDFEIDP